MEHEGRNLTDADAAAVAQALKKALLADLYTEAGKGVVFWVKKVAIIVLLLLAVYGAFGDKVSIGALLSAGRGGG